MKRILTGLLVLLWGVGTPGAAQTDGESLADKINAQSRIQVLTSMGISELYDPHLDGEVLSYSKMRVRRIESASQVDSASRTMPLDEIREIRVRTNAAAEGALTGAIMLGAITLGLGLLASTYEDSFIQIEPRDIAVGTAVGASIGALLGGVIGLASRTWKTVYLAPDHAAGEPG